MCFKLKYLEQLRLIIVPYTINMIGIENVNKIRGLIKAKKIDDV